MWLFPIYGWEESERSFSSISESAVAATRLSIEKTNLHGNEGPEKSGIMKNIFIGHTKPRFLKTKT